MRKKLLDSLKRVFRPEFINRVDNVIVFHALSKDDIRQIVDLELEKVSERLKEHNMTLEATPAAIDQLVEEGYDPDMGARPLRRVIQNKIEDKLSDSILGEKFSEGDAILVDIEAGEDEIHFILRHASNEELAEDEPESVLDMEG
jgi:ATP-dependent Clp protease ATP-binding subunit ClpC